MLPSNDNEFFKLLVAHDMQQQALAYIQRLLSEARTDYNLALIYISEPTRLLSNSYAVFCLQKKRTNTTTRD